MCIHSLKRLSLFIVYDLYAVMYVIVEPLHDNFMIFQGIRTSIAKKPYIFCDFLGWGSTYIKLPSQHSMLGHHQYASEMSW